MEIRTYNAGEIPCLVLKGIEEFLFPCLTRNEDQLKDIDIFRMHNKQSAYLIAEDKGSIVATARVIAKVKPEHKLPVEYSLNESGKEFNLSDALPVCEIGGLKICDKLKIIEKGPVLKSVLDNCGTYVLSNGFKFIYATCAEHLTNFYISKVFFKFEDYVYYGNKKYCALSRKIAS